MFTIEVARPEERPAAFRLIFHYLGDAECTARVGNALAMISTQELEPDGILVVRNGGEPRGALVCVPLAGAGGLVWPPFVKKGPQRIAQEDQLVRAACSWLRLRGAKLAQALLAPANAALARPLQRNGFVHTTRLQYMQHHLHGDFAPSLESLASYQTFRQCPREVFLQILMRTYQGSLDCPELNGVRTPDEILQGHMAQGAFDPERWWLAYEADRPLGVVLASAETDGGGWDLSYVGVVPEARRRGWGRTLTQLVLRQARSAGAAQVTVSVDARNRPACKLYRGMGFEPCGEREVYLTIFVPAAPAKP
jgi:mycothiol synthase